MQISLRLLCFLLLYLSLFLFLIGCSDDREEQVNIEENLSDDLLNILATFNSVKFVFNTQWALESTTVQAALDRSGKVGDLVGKLGKIGIGFTNNTREGTYTVAKWGGPILDQGTLYIREQGGSIGNFGKVDRVEVIKSQMTGYSEKKTTVKHTFKYVGHSSKR